MAQPEPKSDPTSGTAALSGERAARAVPGLRLAILSGLALWLACPPVGLWPLAWVALAPLILSVTRATRFRQAFWRGYLFGWAYLATVWYWIGLTINAWTGSNIGWIAWFAMTLILALFYAVWGGVAWLLARGIASPGARIVALAASWTLLEWLRCWGAVSMPWAQLSYTQVHFLPLIQIADLTGAYGVSFLVMLMNGAVAEWWSARGKANSGRYVWACVTGLVLAMLYGCARLALPERGRTLRVADMQSNFGMVETADSAGPEFQTFYTLTQQASQAGGPPEMYVWSESAAPGDALNEHFTRLKMMDLAHDYRAAVLLGSRIVDPGTQAEFNSSVLFPADGSDPLRYDKQQLVPFGEFIPLRQLIPESLGNAFQVFASDVTPGSRLTPMRFRSQSAGDVAVGPFLCYEAMYPRYARAMTANGANLLCTQSNDAWFHSVAAMEQHLAAVVFRAVENRRQIVRSTTNGITCIVNSKGQVVARAPVGATAFLVRDVRLLGGVTLYTRLGDWFVGLCLVMIVTILWWSWQVRQAASRLARREDRA